MHQNTYPRLRINANKWTSGSEVGVAEDDEVASGRQGAISVR